MKYHQAKWFEELTENRSKSAEALNDFALRGVKNSVVEKYSDQAHFIYELLQNADDAEASFVRFELFDDKLIFIHNGLRRFSITDPCNESYDHACGLLGDINAITAVGGSNKIDEATIGKFGVGFKAVFQYTTTPYIYDSNFFFRIERFIVPILLETDYVGRNPDETLFVFPFNHDKRSAEDSFADISIKLQTLEYPLLFLTNLKKISFEISGVQGFYSKSIVETRTFSTTSAELVNLKQNNPNCSITGFDYSIWMFSRKNNLNQVYSTGFFVDEVGTLIPKSLCAFCFFPTKEVTGLNFIIHAPFLLTDSREGIRAGIPHNSEMIDLLSELSSDSLLYLKDIGLSKGIKLIDDNIFDIIPYNESLFSDISSKNKISFKPFFHAAKRAFMNNTLLPSSEGYVESGNAYWAFVPQIAILFTNCQLAYLSKNANAKWAFPSIGRQETTRRNKALAEYIDSITSDWIYEESILNGWDFENGEISKGITPSFIESQQIEWLHKLYKWISETSTRTRLSKRAPIFLNKFNRACAAFDSQDKLVLFLPSEGESGYETISNSLLQDDETLKFIQQIGVTIPLLQDEIYNIILPQYKVGIPENTDLHFRKFFKHYQKCSASEIKLFINQVKELSFIMFETRDNGECLHGKSDDLYFPSDHLLTWFRSKPDTKFLCFNKYIELVEENSEVELKEFFTALGVKENPRILTRNLSLSEAYDIQSTWQHSNKGKKWTEKYIDGCKEIIENIRITQSFELSLVVWNQLLIFIESGYFNEYNLNDHILYGKYEYFFYSFQTLRYESTEAIRLRTSPWIMRNNGNFDHAANLSLDDICQYYDTSSKFTKELLKILNIKDEINEANDISITSYAKSLGLSEDELREALREFASRKHNSTITTNSQDSLEDQDEIESLVTKSPSLKRIVNEISKRAFTKPDENNQEQTTVVNAELFDEDNYSKPTVNIDSRIEKIKDQAEHDIKEIALLEDLKNIANSAVKYSYSWFIALLELESLNNLENNLSSREISISFSKVEREEGTTRTLTLRHPSRYIPQSMEDLSDIPLELHFADNLIVKVAIEVVSVKSYSLRAKLKSSVQIENVDLSLVLEARIEAKNPVFLLEELRRKFTLLGSSNGYEDEYDMKNNLCENVEFVFGPPGTGKTTYLANEIILPLVRSLEDLKILVLTPTNKSADVLVSRIIECANSDEIYLDWLIRFGATNDNAIEQSGVYREKSFDIRKFARNVTVTTIARFAYDYFLPDETTRLHLYALKWDYIIFDEASMIPLSYIIFPLYLKTPTKFFIAGDPFQIEPISTVDLWKNENIYTMVELNSFKEPKTVPHRYPVKLLTTQYRSVPEIGEVFSQFAYGGVLKHFRKSESRIVFPNDIIFDISSLNIIKFPVSKYESIYRPKRLLGKTPYQVYSALFTFEFVRYITKLVSQLKDKKLFRIGIIAPYRAQSDLIDKLMSSYNFPACVSIQVGTIHGFQGDECDIIIALFNPPPLISTSKEMFLNKLNIINVSISRARDILFILMPDDNTENIENLVLIKKVEQICLMQTSLCVSDSASIEEIMLGNKTFLEENSFSTSHQNVNVYYRPEKRYEVRSEDNAVDVQIHE